MNTQSRIQNTCYLIILFFSAGIISCTKSPEIPEMEDPDIYYNPNMLDTLWTIELFEDLIVTSREKLKYHKGNLYFTFDSNSEQLQNYFAKINLDTQEKEWGVSLINEMSNISSCFYEDYAVFKNWNEYGSYDLRTGIPVQYVNKNTRSNPRANCYGNSMYFSEFNTGRSEVILYKSDLNDLNQEEVIYKLTDSIFPNSTKSIESLNGYKDYDTGHDILLFQHRMTSRENNRGRVDFVFYDMTEGKVMKMYKDIEPNGNSSVAQILIKDDKAYFQGSNTVYCFDLKTQEMLWFQRYLGDKFTSFGLGNLVYAENEDLIVIKADGDWLIAFDPDTGEEVWVNREADRNGVPVSYHEGFIYYIISGELRVVRASDGETVAVKRTPLYSNDSFADGSTVEIDSERKLMYITSGRYIYCAKLIKG